MQPTQVTTPAPTNQGTTQSTKSFDQQLADIKSQARTIVTGAQKLDPKIKIRPVDAEMIGLKPNIPTKKDKVERPGALDTVGTTPSPKTGLDKAREAILGSVKNQEDRDIIDQILQVSTGLQTERGAQLESTADSILTQQLANIKSTRDRSLDVSTQKEAMKLPEMEAELESIRSENDVLLARKNAAIQAAEREKGLSTSALQGNVSRISLDFDLEQANLAIRELASVGKINAATKLIDSKMDLKYGDLEAEANLLTAQISAIKPFLDREDAKAADMRLQLNEVVKGKLADARAEDKSLEEFKLQSYMFAQQNGASPAVLSNIMSSTNRQDVASVGGSFIQDPMQKLQMQEARENILTSQASRANIFDQMRARQDAIRKEAAAEEDKKLAEQKLKLADSEQALNIKNLAEALRTAPGKSGAVGFGFKKSVLGSLPFVSPDAISGTSRADFEAQATRLANMLTLDNLSLMTGTLTDKDIDILASAGSNLSKFNMSEAAYNDEINRIIETMNRTINNNGISTEQAVYWGVVTKDEADTFNSVWDSIQYGIH